MLKLFSYNFPHVMFQNPNTVWHLSNSKTMFDVTAVYNADALYPSFPFHTICCFVLFFCIFFLPGVSSCTSVVQSHGHKFCEILHFFSYFIFHGILKYILIYLWASRQPCRLLIYINVNWFSCPICGIQYNRLQQLKFERRVKSVRYRWFWGVLAGRFIWVGCSSFHQLNKKMQLKFIRV